MSDAFAFFPACLLMNEWMVVTIWPIKPYTNTKTPNPGAMSFNIFEERPPSQHSKHAHGLSDKWPGLKKKRGKK